jgi:hypothetical protein
MEAAFPELFFAFAAPQTRPPAVVFGAIVNFDNYDIWPLSVRIVDPFTKEPLKGKQLTTRMQRRVPGKLAPQLPPQLAGMGIAFQAESVQDLLVVHDPEDEPFLCLPGVREYHHHPAHNGNPWLLHRGTGAGKLHFILEQIEKYAIQPIKGFTIGIQITGFAANEIPE